MGDLKEVVVPCSAHGPQEAKAIFLTEWSEPKCPACEVERAEREARQESERKARELAAAREREISRRLQRAAIPPRFIGKTFDAYVAPDEPSRKALEACRDYAAGFPGRRQAGSSMILCGNAGTGKTHLACAIAMHVIREHGGAAVYMTVSRAFRTVKDTYRRDSDTTEQQAISFLASPDLLVLDEIGVQYGSDTEKAILFEIVNERYEAMKPTILLSNLALPALTEYAGERVIDRMKENGGRLLVFDWKSHRGNA